ncbi:MFS transporter [Ligilactobacillus sp. LYQ135]
MSGMPALNDPSLHWEKRYKRNCFVYIIIYGLLGAVTGITNDTLTSYLDLVAPNVVTRLNIYTAIGSVLMAIMLIYIHKTGYKKVLIVAPILTIATLFAMIYSNNTELIAISYAILMAGIGIYDFMYPLMYSVYVPRKIRTFMMSAVMVTNLVTQAIVTFFGGKVVVWVFSNLMHVSYSKASVLSGDQAKMTGDTLSAYITSYKLVIYIAVAFTALAFVCSLFLKERPSDYIETEAELEERQAKKAVNFKLLAKKDIVLFVVFLALIRFGAYLITPYFSIYLNNYLHIQRGTVSTIITLQTFAMLIGYTFAPWLERKLGSIVSISVMTLSCVPLMFLMARGNMFGSGVALAIGIILFLRSGLANASMPIQQSLQMALVPKNLRPAFSSLITIVNAAMGIIVGIFTSTVLLKSPSGYATAYYIAGGFYTVACILLLVLKRKYNWIMKNETAEEKIEEKQEEAAEKEEVCEE